VVAVKIIGNKEKAYEEGNRLLMVGHHNVIRLLDIVEDADSVGIVMPLMRMDLRMFMKRGSDTFGTRSMQQIKLQTMRAVHHVHTRGLLHLDIKPENIGVDFSAASSSSTISEEEAVRCVLLDFGSSIIVEEAAEQRAVIVQTTHGYYPPELKSLGIISPACDIYSTGVVFGELIESRRQGEGGGGGSGQGISMALSSFQKLSLDMQHENFRRRPSSKDVLVRLGDQDILRPLLLEVNHANSGEPIWTSPIASALRQCNQQSVADTFVNDQSTNLQKLVTLVRSADVTHIRDAFWLLFEASVEEADEGRRVSSATEGGGGGGMVMSVLSILHYFDSRIYIAREHGFFYAKSLDVLSRLPYFVLTDDMKLHLWKISSASHACERPVLRCLSNCWVADDTLLPWCAADRKCWGVRQEVFAVFAARFANDWDAESVGAAASAIRCMRA
jgi:serine/threonine protein kinase